MVATPNDSSERLALYQQVLSAGSDKIDVFQIDVVWPGLLGLVGSGQGEGGDDVMDRAYRPG